MKHRTLDKSEIESLIDRVSRAKGRWVCAEIDAGACQTRQDFDKMHEAENEYLEVYERVVGILTGEQPYVSGG